MTNKSKYRSGLHPAEFFFGYSIMRIPAPQADSLVNLCIQLGLIYRDMRFVGAWAYFRCPLTSAKRLTSACRENEIDIHQISRKGLPALILRYRRRVGIFLGALLFAFLIFLSGRVIWDIRIDGEGKLDEDEVEALLGECGLSVGDVKSKLDVDSIENRLLILSDDISWISVNITGTVAEVEIRETDVVEDGAERYGASNLVASASGVICGFEDVRGNIVVDIGEAVSEGELLVSGLYGSETQGFRYTSAKGKVLAEVERTLSLEIPRKYQKKEYTGRVREEKSLIFFKNEIKFFIKGGNSYASCDKIDTVEYISMPGGVEIPVGVRTVRYMEYSYTDTERSEGELRRIAEYRLGAMLDSELKDGELLRLSETSALTDEFYSLSWQIKSIENIAIVKEIEIDITP